MKIKTQIFAGLLIASTVVRPASAANYVSQGGLTWMPTISFFTWPEANAYCAKTVINGHTGWRLPTINELSALYASGAMKVQEWTIIWSSTPKSAGIHLALNLKDGGGWQNYDKKHHVVTCVR